jgi:hypothetical protein
MEELTKQSMRMLHLRPNPKNICTSSRAESIKSICFLPWGCTVTLLILVLRIPIVPISGSSIDGQVSLQPGCIQLDMSQDWYKVHFHKWMLLPWWVIHSPSEIPPVYTAWKAFVWVCHLYSPRPTVFIRIQLRFHINGSYPTAVFSQYFSMFLAVKASLAKKQVTIWVHGDTNNQERNSRDGWLS